MIVYSKQNDGLTYADQGLLVAFEGPDGCGKSSTLEAVAASLDDYDVPVVKTREPGGSEFGRRLRAMLKDPTLQDETPGLARRLLFEADRMIHEQYILRWFRTIDDVVVLSDRTALVSNTAYGEAEKTDLSAMKVIENLPETRLIPDLAIVLDAPEEVCRARLEGEGKGADAKEVDLAERDQSLFHRVHRKYREMCREATIYGRITNASGFHVRAVVVSADRPQPEVVFAITQIIMQQVAVRRGE